MEHLFRDDVNILGGTETYHLVESLTSQGSLYFGLAAVSRQVDMLVS